MRRTEIWFLGEQIPRSYIDFNIYTDGGMLVIEDGGGGVEKIPLIRISHLVEKNT